MIIKSVLIRTGEEKDIFHYLQLSRLVLACSSKKHIESLKKNPLGLFAKIIFVKLMPIESFIIWINPVTYICLNYSDLLFHFLNSILVSFKKNPLYQVHCLSWNFFQTSFWGLSGHIKFDNFGLRTNYRLNLLEVSLSRGLARVTYFHNYFLNFKTHTFMSNIKSIVSSIEQNAI